MAVGMWVGCPKMRDGLRCAVAMRLRASVHAKTPDLDLLNSANHDTVPHHDDQTGRSRDIPAALTTHHTAKFTC